MEKLKPYDSQGNWIAWSRKWPVRIFTKDGRHLVIVQAPGVSGWRTMEYFCKFLVNDIYGDDNNSLGA